MFVSKKVKKFTHTKKANCTSCKLLFPIIVQWQTIHFPFVTWDTFHYVYFFVCESLWKWVFNYIFYFFSVSRAEYLNKWVLPVLPILRTLEDFFATLTITGLHTHKYWFLKEFMLLILSAIKKTLNLTDVYHLDWKYGCVVYLFCHLIRKRAGSASTHISSRDFLRLHDESHFHNRLICYSGNGIAVI